ncbi:MAG: zinc-dependent metalloprotease [Xanthomonadaceae bacterium]|nr:zinc-dependent metalloprotease [Xanthomonadaceae bacterium]
MLTGVLLFALASAPPIFEPLEYDVARVNIAVLSQPAGTLAALTLPGGLHFEAVVHGVRVHPNGNSTWNASLLHAEQGGYLLTVTGGEASGLVGTLMTPHGEYRLEPVPGQSWNVVSIDEVRSFVPDDDGARIVEPRAGGPLAAGQKAGAASSDLSVFRILLLYTDEARAERSDAHWGAWLDNLIAVTNSAFEQSGIKVAFELTGHRRVGANDVAEASTLLSEMVPTASAFDAAVFDEVERWRVAAAAHFVTLAKRATGSYCGYANIMPQCDGTGSCLDAAIGYSVISVSCASLVLAHELGHNFGSHHEPGAGPATQPYAYGHVNTVPVRTVMSVNQAAPRIARFSSPELDCNGAPCGVADLSDNTQAINQSRHQVERWISERSVAVSVMKSTVPRGGTVNAHVSLAGLLGGRVDVALWRNGASVAELYSGIAPRGLLALVVPGDVAVGGGYKLVARATLAPEYSAESTQFAVTSVNDPPKPSSGTAPPASGGGGSLGWLQLLLLAAFTARQSVRARRARGIT